MEMEIDGRRINKVWSQAYRTKMASAVYKKIVDQVRDVWTKKIEKEDDIKRKKLKGEMNKWIKSMSKTLTKEFKQIDKDSLEYFLQGQYGITEASGGPYDKLRKMGIPTDHWHTDSDTAKSCTELLDSEIDILRDIGFALLEFMRTGHRNEWVDVCDIVRGYERAKENK